MAEEIKNDNKTTKEKRPFQKGGFKPARGYAGKENFVKEFESALLDLARVTRVTKGGKRMSFRAVVAAGDKKGQVGIGVEKGKDVQQAVQKATRAAQKRLVKVSIANETIPHQVEAKAGAARILLKPQSRGRGLIAGGVVKIICDLAGIKNVSSKIISRTKNKLNNARATIKALQKLKVKR